MACALTQLSQLAHQNDDFQEFCGEKASRINVWVSGIACSVDQVSFGPVAIGVASSGHVFAIESALQGRQGAPLLEYRREPALCRWQGGAAAGAVAGRDR